MKVIFMMIIMMIILKVIFMAKPDPGECEDSGGQGEDFADKIMSYVIPFGIHWIWIQTY